MTTDDISDRAHVLSADDRLRIARSALGRWRAEATRLAWLVWRGPYDNGVTIDQWHEARGHCDELLTFVRQLEAEAA